jgi:dihydrofolate synthase / folylpolyglutamate synthase
MARKRLHAMTANSPWDYDQALAELWRRSSYERGLISDPFGDAARAERGLARMRALLALLGNPQLRYPTVHIAGSKGKGSTGAFIASAATRAGLRVGFYTSPHLHRFPERIAIDGRPLPDEDFAAQAGTVTHAAAVLDAAAPDAETVSTFEFVTAMGFAAFARHNCDLAVIEVGLGGRFDSTNVLAPTVSVITRIDLEHTAVLGSTYGEIAAQKAGIMRAGVPCVASPQPPEAREVIEDIAATVGAPLFVGGRDWTWTGSWRSFTAAGPWGAWDGLSLGIAGPHQVENACTALAALHLLNSAGISISEAAIRRGLARARWPGRFERWAVGEREIVFDAAHTPAAAAALVETWRDADLPPHATVILGMGADKNLRAFLETIRPIVGHLIVTRSDNPRAAPLETIAAIADELGIPHETQPSVAASIAAATKTIPAPLLITGSLFVAGEGREVLGLAEPDLIWRALNEVRDPQH